MTAARVACVHVPDLVVWALRRHDPTLRAAPVVVGGVPPHGACAGAPTTDKGTVTGVSAEARRGGVRRGMTLAEAQSLLPAARFVRPDAELERRETRDIAALLRTFTPRVEEPGAGGATFFLDTRGLGRIHATEEAFARRVRDALAARGTPARVGIAATKFTALVAAREARDGGVHVVPPGRDRDFLAPLALAHLPLDDGLGDDLRALGIRTLGAWTALPADGVAARFGARALALQALARGEDPSLLVGSSGEDPIEAGADLDEPTDDLDLLTFHLKRAIDSLTLALANRGLAVSIARVTLALEDHTRAAREARFVRPTLAPRLLLDCLRTALAREPFAARVAGFTLTALEHAPARVEQLKLFARRQATSPAAVEEALARIRALVGDEGVVSPRPADAWRPEAQVQWEPYAGTGSGDAGETRRQRPGAGRREPAGRARGQGAGRGGLTVAVPAADADDAGAGATAAGASAGAGTPLSLPLRLLPVPVAAEVMVARGRPVHLAVEHLRGAVLHAAGPHRVEGEWWGDAYAREYWVLTLERGERTWVFRDRASGSWRLHGIFD